MRLKINRLFKWNAVCWVSFYFPIISSHIFKCQPKGTLIDNKIAALQLMPLTGMVPQMMKSTSIEEMYCAVPLSAHIQAKQS